MLTQSPITVTVVTDDHVLDERSSLLGLGGGGGGARSAQDKKAQLVKAAFYGVQVFYSFFIM